MSIVEQDTERRALRVAALLLVAAAAATCAPLWAPLVLAVWTAGLARPLSDRAARALKGRHKAAAALTFALVVVLVVPLAALTVAIVNEGSSLVHSLIASQDTKNALVKLVSSGDGEQPSSMLERALSLARSHGAQAMRIAGGVAGAAASVLVGVFVFFLAAYATLADGPRMWKWIVDHSPLATDATERLGRAFHETGRGLFIGIGLAGLAQSVVATIAYLALGVPRAIVLGALTLVASIIPSFGTALVWVPVAAGLALAGFTGKAIAMAVVGIVVISSIDNVLRPVFARYGELRLPTVVLIVAIFGGLALFGAWGVMLGPLVVRLAREAVEVARQHHLVEKRAG